jgi:hypothetical protein
METHSFCRTRPASLWRKDVRQRAPFSPFRPPLREMKEAADQSVPIRGF